jgi:hypothetical protein
MTLPALTKWQRLYSLASEVKSLKPWDFIHEDDVFGVQHPSTKEIGFASIMGSLGEHYSLTFYLGTESLALFWHMRSMDRVTPDMILEIQQLQLNFENREFLQKEDLELLKRLGLSFRGKASWPVFKRQEPGFFPWLLDDQDLDWMIILLEQSINVMARIKANPALVEMTGDYDYLVRTAENRNGELLWKDTVQIIKPSIEFNRIDIEVPAQLMENARQLIRKNVTIEMDIRLMPSPIRQKNAKPYFPYVIIVADSQSGMILGFETIPPLPDLNTMRQSLPRHGVNFFLKNNLLPVKIHYIPSFSMDYLIPVLEALQIQCDKKKKLRHIDEAWNMLLKTL